MWDVIKVSVGSLKHAKHLYNIMDSLSEEPYLYFLFLSISPSSQCNAFSGSPTHSLSFLHTHTQTHTHARAHVCTNTHTNAIHVIKCHVVGGNKCKTGYNYQTPLCIHCIIQHFMVTAYVNVHCV